ncbi:MAG: hypothetical protein ACREDL_10755, partial [Bradyrhizobium sp.]
MLPFCGLGRMPISGRVDSGSSMLRLRPSAVSAAAFVLFAISFHGANAQDSQRPVQRQVERQVQRQVPASPAVLQLS